MRRRLFAVIPKGLPMLLKKDAHPENWLVGSRGRIVMLDLEASAKRPRQNLASRKCAAKLYVPTEVVRRGVAPLLTAGFSCS